jgi:hypothetical protein
MGTREDSHEINRRRVQTFVDLVNTHTKATAKFRAGAQSARLKPGKKPKLKDRIAGEDLEGCGNDILLTSKGKSKWCTMFPVCKSNRKMFPYGDVLRIKAPSPGTPILEEVLEVFGNQWGIICIFLGDPKTIEYIIDILGIRLEVFFNAPYGKRDNKNIISKVRHPGFFFPDYDGRKSTVELYTKVVGDAPLWCKPPIKGPHTGSIFSDRCYLSVQGLIKKIFSESV